MFYSLLHFVPGALCRNQKEYECIESLFQVEGWEEFDERRRLKYQKQLDFRAGGSAAFDEGADKN